MCKSAFVMLCRVIYICAQEELYSTEVKLPVQ